MELSPFVALIVASVALVAAFPNFSPPRIKGLLHFA
jgi:hypothetical protein